LILKENAGNFNPGTGMIMLQHLQTSKEAERLKILGSVTTASPENKGHPITLIHPTHFSALHHANIWDVNADDPTLSKFQQSNKIAEGKIGQEDQTRQRQ
jgi:hypothetical protein